MYTNSIEKNRIPQGSPTRKNCKMLQARFDWACSWTVLEMQATVHIPQHRFKQNSKFKHEKSKILNLETPAVFTAVIMEPSMWHSIVIPWKTVYGPQVKKCVSLKRKFNERN
jgi:hypothetical protein